MDLHTKYDCYQSSTQRSGKPSSMVSRRCLFVNKKFCLFLRANKNILAHPYPKKR